MPFGKMPIILLFIYYFDDSDNPNSLVDGIQTALKIHSKI